VVLTLAIAALIGGGRSNIGVNTLVKADSFGSCEQATVQGRYGFLGQGVVGFGTPEAAQAVESGTAAFDGQGKLSGSVTFSENGQIVSTPYTGTYQANSDCTISMTLFFGSQVRHQQGVIVNGAKEIDAIETDPGSILTRVAKRIDRD
jgi:hypothetical protein